VSIKQEHTVKHSSYFFTLIINTLHHKVKYFSYLQIMKFRKLHDSEYSAYIAKSKVSLYINKDGYTDKAIAEVVN